MGAGAPVIINNRDMGKKSNTRGITMNKFEEACNRIVSEGVYKEHGESVLKTLTDVSNEVTEVQHELASTYDPELIQDMLEGQPGSRVP